ncbi:conserved hypothetical protein [Culex quinquefasciatus]|uniref:WD repeat-containing protein 55 homolog n=1 Tax=Culex quinquefasciatus TaxID=7176 RepID=B0WCC0_CULQU|nr:conserved hypothetical protein [Culex quinquefasciatus]|eukprot:XP_001846354.1 conserved hypothetical protein [Culex quinquefasciatus]
MSVKLRFLNPQSSDEESPVPDADSCDPQQLQSHFKSSVRSRSEVAISLKRTCGLHLSLSSDSRKLAVGSSRKELQLYQLAENGDLLVESADFDKFKSPIRGVRFFNGDPNLLMACTEEGVVSLYDLRLGKSVFGFEDGSEGPRKTMTTFDENALITTGESGLITVWSCGQDTEQEATEGSIANKLKQKATIGKRAKPY